MCIILNWIIIIILRKEILHLHLVPLWILLHLLFLGQKSSVLLEQGLQDQEVTIVPLNEKIEDLHTSALSVLESKQNFVNQF